MPELLDCRRLTGANRISALPGAVIDVAVDVSARDKLIAAWNLQARRMLDTVGWQRQRTAVSVVEGGVSLAVSAPVDALYAATDLCEWALSAALATVPCSEAQFIAAVNRLRAQIDAEAKPALLALRAAAADRGVAFLSDDDTVSVGQGCGSMTWPVADLPDTDTIAWQRVHDIPVGLVTGTNGKTTSVRIAASIARAAGLATGVSSTDGIAVDEAIIDHGDYSGPGGTRAVLRHGGVQAAILETARGGLVRRGLGTDHASAVLLTNLSADHIGDFGCRTLEELLDIKWTATRALRDGGRLVLGASDPLLAGRGRDWKDAVAWFTLDETDLGRVMRAGDEAWTLRGDQLGAIRAGSWTALCSAAEIPITLGGAAAHNIANALGAAALASGMGLADDAIRAGLKSVRAEHNPGRANLFAIDGRRVVLDFAHNPAAVRAVLKFAQTLPAARRLIAFSEAGDRPDRLLHELARAAWSIEPDRVVLSELADYRRGRAAGEVVGILRDELVAAGASVDQISCNEREIDSVAEALDWSRPGDLLILLVLGERAAVYEMLKKRADM